MTVLARLRAKDADLLNLRKAARATLVAVPLFAALHASADLAALSTFAFFACFVGLVFGDFGGPPRPRALAYLAMIVLGDLVIVIGSLLSDSVAGAGAAMFAVMFAASFAAVFGGYAPAFVAPIALAYSLAVLDPLSDLAIGLRVAGWTIGGGAALVAALVLWPVDRRLRLRQTLAEVCAGLATALESIRDNDSARAAYAQAVKALATARQKASSPLRPAGPLSHDLGLLHLGENLEQAVDMAGRVLDGGWTPGADDQLAAECAGAYRHAAAVLGEEVDPGAAVADLPRLDEALLARRRTADQAAMLTAATGADGGQAAAEALAGMRRSFPIMALSHIAMWVDAAAATALGAGAAVGPLKISPELAPLSDRLGATMSRARSIVSGALDPDGVIFRNSIRAAAAMTLAVVLAQVAPVDHGFWITLGALLVLRSSAGSTSATALQAVGGTLVGFLVAGLITALVGDDDAVLWVLLPFAVFFSAYTPGAVSFMVGQVSFTTMVVVLFNLIDNQGILTDLARVETVSLGAAIGALMALILWPHGARVALAHAVAGVYGAAAEALRTLVTGSAAARQQANRAMHLARRRADEAFGVALSERGQQIDTEAWMALFRAPNAVHSLAGGLIPQPPPWIADHCGAAIAAMVVYRDRVADALARVADRLDQADAAPSQPPRADGPDDRDATLMECFDRARAEGTGRVDETRLLIALSEWLTYVDDYLSKAAPELDQVAAASRPGAWLRWSTPERVEKQTTDAAGLAEGAGSVGKE